MNAVHSLPNLSTPGPCAQKSLAEPNHSVHDVMGLNDLTGSLSKRPTCSTRSSSVPRVDLFIILTFIPFKSNERAHTFLHLH